MHENRFPHEEHVYSSTFDGKLKDQTAKEKPFWRQHFSKLYIVVSTILVLILGYSTATMAMTSWQKGSVSSPADIPEQSTPLPANTPLSTPDATPTTSSTQAGTVLCHADWSQGMDGWSGTPDWKYVSQMLVNDGSAETYDDRVILAPCEMSTSNYSVESQIQFVRYNGGFGVLARGGGGITTGYKGWIQCGTYDSYISITRAGSSLVSNDYKTDNSWHTYRFEVRNEKLTFFIDGQQIMETTDTTYLSAGRVGLVVNGDTQINVKSFQVTAL